MPPLLLWLSPKWHPAQARRMLQWMLFRTGFRIFSAVYNRTRIFGDNRLCRCQRCVTWELGSNSLALLFFFKVGRERLCLNELVDVHAWKIVRSDKRGCHMEFLSISNIFCTVKQSDLSSPLYWLSYTENRWQWPGIEIAICIPQNSLKLYIIPYHFSI